MIAFLVPARSGSKGLPGKNVRVLNDVPLIAYSIKVAQKFDQDASVYVLTDGIDIKDVGEACGAIVPYLRSSVTSSDTASTESVIDEFIVWLDIAGISVDKIVLLQPTSPLRYAASIKGAIKLLDGHDSVVSVCESHSFYWQFRENKAKSVNYDFKNRPRRQDIMESDKSYQETGSIYAFDVAGYRINRNRLFGKIGLLKTLEQERFEIDTELDFNLLEFLIKEYKYEV